MPEFENRNKFLELAKDMTSNPFLYGQRKNEELRKTIISNLDHMRYDDFDERSFDAPKTKMVEDFTALGRLDIVEKIKDGEYDQ